MRRRLAPLLLVIALASAGLLVTGLLLPPRARPPAAVDAPAAPSPGPPTPPQARATAIPATAGPPAQPPAPPAPTPPAPAPLPPTPTATAAPPAPAAAIEYSYPLGLPGRALGDGFVVRHGMQTENTWYNPGHWHTGEDWYAQEGDTGGASVFAIAAGAVVYAGGNYPGRVLLVAHADGLVAMYGHLDPDLAVAVGDQVERGQLLGTVLAQVGARAPSHLHLELRTFVTAEAVNGSSPRYGYRCGVACPPGPGYWPIAAPDLPVDLGWRNPSHTIARRMAGPAGAVVMATTPVSPSLGLWSGPPDDAARRELAVITPAAGERLPLLGVWAGEEAPRATSALAYQLWYQVRLPDGRAGWVQAAVPLNADTGADGRPSGVGFTFIPDVAPAP